MSPMPTKTPMLTVRDWKTDPWCLNGWDGCTEWYTGGHYCQRDYQHKGRCVCVCKATTTRPAPDITGDL